MEEFKIEWFHPDLEAASESGVSRKSLMNIVDHTMITECEKAHVFYMKSGGYMGPGRLIRIDFGEN